MISLRQWLREAAERLQLLSEQGEQEARWLAQAVLNMDTGQLFLALDLSLSEDEVQSLESKVQLRESGLPLAYVIGQWSFYGLDLVVTHDTLIPRPETEQLVEYVLSKYPNSNPFDLLDLGTGSGAIALAIAKERPCANILALDACRAAIKVARNNAEQLGLRNVKFLVSHWCSALKGQPAFDIIVSNPPYLSDNDPHLSGPIRYEPRKALVAGCNGMEDLAKILEEAFIRLRQNGTLILEHGFDQAKQLRAMLKAKGFKDIKTLCDYAGHERVTQGVVLN